MPVVLRPLLAVVMLPALLAPAAMSASPAAAAEPRAAVTFIGDSTMAGMGPSAQQIVADRYDLTFEAKSCRRLIIPSCGRLVQHPNTIDVMRTLGGRLGDALVIMAGYDDWEIADAVDVIVAEADRQAVPLVVWVTYRTGVSYTGPAGVSNDATFRRHNGVLQAALAEHPSLRLADWDAHARNRSDWFSADGIHLSAAGATALGTFLTAELDRLPVGRCRADRPEAGEVAAGSPAPPTAAGTFTAVAPERLADTRATAPVGAGRVVPVTVAGAATVPAAASAALVNVTAVDPCRPGYLTAFPCGGAPPLASTLNYVTGETRANLAAVGLGAGGALCVLSSARADVLVDLMGWFAPGTGLPLLPVSHQRLVDTRDGAGGTPRPAGSWLAVDAPAGVAVVNVTVTEPGAAGFVAVTPTAADGSCAGAPPNASTLNHRRAQTTANLAAVATGTGRFCVFTWAAAHLVVDLTSTAAPGGSAVAAQAPARVLDTRTPAGPGVVAGRPVPVRVEGAAGGTGMVLNVTAAGATAPGFVTAYRAALDGSCPATAPLASSLNPVPGPPAAAMVVVPTGGDGTACLQSSTALDLVVDVTAVLVPA